MWSDIYNTRYQLLKYDYIADLYGTHLLILTMEYAAENLISMVRPVIHLNNIKPALSNNCTGAVVLVN